MAHFQRSTKSRITGMSVQNWDVDPFVSGKKENAISIRFNASDGKKYSLSFYGEEVEQLIKAISKCR